MNAFQCPRCTVRVRYANELRDHLTTDHPDFESVASSVEDDLLGACLCHHPTSPSHGRWLHDPADKNAA
jgi:hypothetical protein